MKSFYVVCSTGFDNQRGYYCGHGTAASHYSYAQTHAWKFSRRTARRLARLEGAGTYVIRLVPKKGAGR